MMMIVFLVMDHTKAVNGMQYAVCGNLYAENSKQ